MKTSSHRDGRPASDGQAPDRAREAAAAGHGEGEPKHPFGVPGPPVNRRNFYLIGLLLSLGAITGYALLWAVTTARQELLLIAVALVLALGLDPLVNVLTRRGLSRAWAVATVALSGVTTLGGFLAWLVPVLSQQATEFADHLPAYLKSLQDNNSTIGQFNARYHVLDSLQSKIANGGVASIAGGLFGAGKLIVNAVVATVLVIVLTLYFLATLPSVKEFC
jgi:predicted PurR-regulated permease PerM